MRIIKFIVMSCLALALFCFPAAAQECPEQGSGLEGVEGFIETLESCSGAPPSFTCNGEFSVEMVGFEPVDSFVTMTYEVCNLGEAPLNYWVLGLGQMLDCLAESATLYDLVVACSVYTADVNDLGDACGFVQPDFATLLEGIRFDAAVGAGECRTFTVTLDETALDENFEIGLGCVAAATQSGEQDIILAENPVPGYVSIPGPVCQAIQQEPEYECPKGLGYWKNHRERWPVDSLMLGNVVYTSEQLMLILKTAVRGDASLILARQLVAAKLNVAYGADPTPVSDTIASADASLAAYDGLLPYKVRPRTPAGKLMIQDAYMLDQYNNGELTPGCEE